MPQIKIERIVTFNTEDPIHCANNILSGNTQKKWKCKSPGEKNAVIVLQLDQPYVITGIDIGNDHSAYIEVLVARSSNPEDYKVLLVMSSFMTPLEARQSQNINKVRMFKQEDLSEPERKEKWDRVKVVCTQPFNRHVQYGLSFINLHTGSGKIPQVTQPTIGKFIIRPESPDNISAGSLFARRKELKEEIEDKPKGAGAIREATSLALSGSPVIKPKLKHSLPASTGNTPKVNKNQDKTDSPKPRNRNELLYKGDEEGSSQRVDKIIEKNALEKAEKEKQKQNEKEKLKIEKQKESKVVEKKRQDKEKNKQYSPSSSSKNKETKENTHKKTNESHKRKKSEDSKEPVKKKKVKHPQKPFAKLLEDVVLVISGIQNPDRASLRTMAMSMGAKYKPDWDSTCTHLICAFTNTPKFNQVKGKGKIVKRDWIQACYNEKKRLPWRRYALDKADKGEESEEEIWEEDTQSLETTPEPSPKPATSNDSLSDTDVETREEGSDTEEIIQQIQNRQAAQKRTDIFEADTDLSDTESKISDNLEFKNKLKSFFDNKIFYIDEIFDENTRKKLKQYIVAYKGLVVDDLEANIEIIVTNHANTKVLHDLYPDAVCISQDWIWTCHNSQSLEPMDDFILS